MPGRQAVPTVVPIVVDMGGITAEGRVEPRRFTSIASDTDGLVSQVLAKEGDQVQAGQIIVRLDGGTTRSLEAAQAAASVELSAAYEAARVAQAKLDAYPMPRIFVGLTAEQAARNWLEALDAARVGFQPYEGSSRKTLKPNHIFPSLPRRIWFDTNEYKQMAREYKKKLDIAWVNYRKATAWLALEADLESAKARLAQAQKNSAGLQDSSLSTATAGARAALANAEVRAPFAGTITNLDLGVGEVVSAGDAVVTIGDFSSWVVKTTDLTEIDVVNIGDGQPVTVFLDSVPGAHFRGSVQSISQSYTERQGDVVYAATVLLQEQSPLMRWGMTAHVSFAPQP